MSVSVSVSVRVRVSESVSEIDTSKGLVAVFRRLARLQRRASRHATIDKVARYRLVQAAVPFPVPKDMGAAAA